MSDVSVKMGVSGISQFKQGMTDAQASVKTLDAALKNNEKQLKATGDAESYMQKQTELLNSKLEAQKTIAKNAEQALKQMEANGVEKTSAAYQNMQRKLLEAQGAIMDTQTQMTELGTKAADASGKADKLADSLGGLNRKVSLEQVTSAINSITGGLENAAQKAVQLGTELWNTIMDSAGRADDTATMAEWYGIDLVKFQQMQKLVTNGMDTSVEAMLTSQDKLKRGIGSDSKQVMQYLEDLGLVVTRYGKYEDIKSLVTDDSVELFWEAGKALMAMGDAYDQEAAATALFGRSWKELKPLFDTYGSLEEYNAARDAQEVNTEETIRNLAELNDAVSKLEGSWQTLKDELIGAVAPALTSGADAISGLLDSLVEYSKTEEGQQMLEGLGKAVEGLFKDITEIDPQQVMESFSGVFDGIVGGLQWLEANSGNVVGALEAIVAGWGVLKLAGGALEIYKLITGIMGLGGAGAAADAAAAGTAIGSSWGGAFASAVMTAAPWLVGLAILLTPGGTAGDDLDSLIDQNGNLTQAGKDAGFTLDDSGNLTGGPSNKSDSKIHPMKDGRQEPIEEKNQPQVINLTWDDTPVSTMGSAGQAMSLLDLIRGDKEAEVPVEPVVPEDAAEQIADHIGTVLVGMRMVPVSFTGGAGGGGGGKFGVLMEHANGLPWVPFDGYPALLHKGERVVTARDNEVSRNFSSNLYVESMYMNNGQDAEGLAAAMAAANRRTMRGYGS